MSYTPKPKQYNLTVTGTNWTTNYAWGVPYKDINGNWHLKFNIQGEVSVATNTLSLTISGVEMSSTYTLQSCAGGTTTGVYFRNCYARSATDDIYLVMGANASVFYASGDIVLDSKPTWA